MVSKKKKKLSNANKANKFVVQPTGQKWCNKHPTLLRNKKMLKTTKEYTKQKIFVPY